MSKNQSAANLTSCNLPKQRVVLYGDAGDKEVLRSMRSIRKSGRMVTTKARPDFDTGVGQCGKHLCNCRQHCKEQFEGRE